MFDNSHGSQVSREYLCGYKQDQILNRRSLVLGCETEIFLLENLPLLAERSKW